MSAITPDHEDAVSARILPSAIAKQYRCRSHVHTNTPFRCAILGPALYESIARLHRLPRLALADGYIPPTVRYLFANTPGLYSRQRADVASDHPEKDDGFRCPFSLKFHCGFLSLKHPVPIASQYWLCAIVEIFLAATPNLLAQYKPDAINQDAPDCAARAF